MLHVKANQIHVVVGSAAHLRADSYRLFMHIHSEYGCQRRLNVADVLEQVNMMQHIYGCTLDNTL